MEQDTKLTISGVADFKQKIPSIIFLATSLEQHVDGIISGGSRFWANSEFEHAVIKSKHMKITQHGDKLKPTVVTTPSKSAISAWYTPRSFGWFSHTNFPRMCGGNGAELMSARVFADVTWTEIGLYGKLSSP